MRLPCRASLCLLCLNDNAAYRSCPKYYLVSGPRNEECRVYCHNRRAEVRRVRLARQLFAVLPNFHPKARVGRQHPAIRVRQIQFRRKIITVRRKVFAVPQPRICHRHVCNKVRLRAACKWPLRAPPHRVLVAVAPNFRPTAAACLHRVITSALKQALNALPGDYFIRADCHIVFLSVPPWPGLSVRPFLR